MAILCPESPKCAPLLSVCDSVVTFHWCSVYVCRLWLLYIWSPFFVNTETILFDEEVLKDPTLKTLRKL